MLIPFALPPGIHSDDTTFAAEGRWTDGDGFRFYRGLPETINYESVNSFTSIPSMAYALHAFSSGGTNYIAWGYARNLAIGTVTNGVADAPTARLAAPLSTDAIHWSMDDWGGSLLAAPRRGTLYEWTGSGNANPIATAPDNINIMLVDPVRRQVLAFGCNEVGTGTFNGLCFRCSNFEDNTDWTPTDSNSADEVVVDGGGEFVAAKWIGDDVVAWTSTSMFLGRFVGDPQQIWRFDKVEGGVGCAGQDAVVIMDGIAYWLAPNRAFYRYAVGMPPTSVPCPISRDFIENALIVEVSDIVVRAVALRRRGEIWWFYRDARDSSITVNAQSRYVAYSVAESVETAVWFRGTRKITAALASPVMDALSLTGAEAYLATESSGSLALDEIRPIYSGNSSAVAYIQSGDRYLEDSQRRLMVRSFIPDFEEQSEAVDLTLYVRDRPQSAAVAKGPYTIGVGATKKDVRASGKIISVRLAPSNGGRLRLGKQLFDAVPLGER